MKNEIRLTRAEGLHRECLSATCESISQAQVVLWNWATSAPKFGTGIHKVDFWLVENGEERYKGMYGLKQDNSLSLKEHIERSMAAIVKLNAENPQIKKEIDGLRASFGLETR